jgi:hypothetical protein
MKRNAQYILNKRRLEKLVRHKENKRKELNNRIHWLKEFKQDVEKYSNGG